MCHISSNIWKLFFNMYFKNTYFWKKQSIIFSAENHYNCIRQNKYSKPFEHAYQVVGQSGEFSILRITFPQIHFQILISQVEYPAYWKYSFQLHLFAKSSLCLRIQTQVSSTLGELSHAIHFPVFSISGLSLFLAIKLQNYKRTIVIKAVIHVNPLLNFNSRKHLVN